MANKKITDLSPLLATNANDLDVIEIVDVSADSGNGTSLKMTVAELRTLITNALVIGTDVQAWAAVLDNTTASFLTADETKLDGISTGAEVNPDLISQAEAEAGTATTERIFSALRVAQAIAALGGGSPAGSTTQLQYNLSGAFAASAFMTFVNGLILTAQNPTDIPLNIHLDNSHSVNGFVITDFNSVRLVTFDEIGNVEFGGTPVNNTAERILTLTNPRAATGNFQNQSLFLAIGEGSNYSEGRGIIGGINSAGTRADYLEFEYHTSAPIVRFLAKLAINNNIAIISKSTTFVTVPIFKFNSSNDLEIGPRSNNPYGVKFYVGDNTADYNWFVNNGGANLMTLKGTGLLGINKTAPIATLDVNGSVATKYVTKTANYTLTTTDNKVFCTGTHTQTLPTAVGVNGVEYTIKNIGVGTITMGSTSSQTIDGSAAGSVTLTAGVSYTFMAYEGNWQII